jgi:hypothetical protein
VTDAEGIAERERYNAALRGRLGPVPDMPGASTRRAAQKSVRVSTHGSVGGLQGRLDRPIQEERREVDRSDAPMTRNDTERELRPAAEPEKNACGPALRGKRALRPGDEREATAEQERGRPPLLGRRCVSGLPRRATAALGPRSGLLVTRVRALRRCCRGERGGSPA